MTRYWGFRIDRRHTDYFFKEIKGKRLRMGWGYEEDHDLTLGDKTGEAARKNFSIYNKVKKGDILLVPHIEGWDDITIVRAKEDFNSGYKFEIDSHYKDYGHIFPVEYVTHFSKNHDLVAKNIRETMKCRSRFWNIDRCEKAIEIIIKEGKPLSSQSTYEQRFQKRALKAFNENNFADEVYNELKKYTEGSEWEHVLCEGFKKIFPKSYLIETTSNKTEAEHGADILIHIPGIPSIDIPGKNYVIAIQVKDYEGVVSASPVEQICKAETYFKDHDETLIDKYVIITRAEDEKNTYLIDKAKEKNVKLIFMNDLKRLLSQMGRAFIGQSDIE